MRLQIAQPSGPHASAPAPPTSSTTGWLSPHARSSSWLKTSAGWAPEAARERLTTKKADLYQRAGRYSQALVKSDSNTILALYRANGFSQAKVTGTAKDVDAAVSALNPDGTIDVRVGGLKRPQQTERDSFREVLRGSER